MRNRAGHAFAAIAVSMLLPAVCHSQSESKATGGYAEYILGLVPDPVMLSVTADKQHTFYVMPLGDRSQVLFDGQAMGPDLDTNSTFVEWTFGISADGKHTGYAVGKEDPTNECHTCGPQGKWHPVIDGVAGPEYDKVMKIAFSPDGQHIAYGAIDRKKQNASEKDHWVMVVDGKKTPIPYEAISRDSPIFSPDGILLVYVGKKGEKAVVVVGDQEGPAYDRIKQSIPVFSPGGKHMAYIARRFDEPGETMVLDGIHGPYFDNIPELSMVFSSDGERLAYGGQTGGIGGSASTWAVVVDGKPGPQYDQVDNIVFSPDGKHVAYKAKQNNKWMLVVNGKPGLECDDMVEGFPVFSPDSSRIAYGSKEGGKWRVKVDVLAGAGKDQGLSGVIGGKYDQKVGMITFSPDGKHLAFGGINGKKKTVVLDGKSGAEHDFIGQVLFSPDGKRLAYEAGIFEPAKDDRWFMVVDGKARPEQGTLIHKSFLFSRDGKHDAYLVNDGSKSQAVIDGQMSPKYKTICHLLATDDNGFESIVVGDTLSWMSWKP